MSLIEYLFLKAWEKKYIQQVSKAKDIKPFSSTIDFWFVNIEIYISCDLNHQD